MSQKAKAALIALAVIVALTAAKYILYLLSGSVAVLSEALHSTTDIATTLLVVISIYRQEWKKKNSVLTEDKEVQEPTGKFAVLQGYIKRIAAIPTELKVSLVISLLLCSVAGGILRQAWMGGAGEISMPLITGGIFVLLSFGSFFLYRFEENIGQEEESAALTADSQHNRADMVVSLVTGISLILYHFGYNFDRYVGFFISAYILVFSIELLVNTIYSIRKHRDGVVIEYNFTSIIWRVFRLKTYSFITIWLEKNFDASSRIKKSIQAIPGILSWLFRWGIRTAIAVALILYLSTMLYTVKPGQQALQFRFGKIVDSEIARMPGLHLKLPWPIDTITYFDALTVRELTIGNAAAKDVVMIWSKEHGDDQTFISGDNNLFLPYIVIHYRIKNIFDYHLTHRNKAPEKILESVAYRVFTEIFVSNTFYDLILNKRQHWTQNSIAILQKENDKLKTGLEVMDICLKDLHPPISLAGAYEDVVAARQLREKYLNDAKRRVVSSLTRERMTAFKTVTEAGSYVFEKKSLAEGEAQNYLLRYSGYQNGGETMKNLLLLKAAEETLKNKKIYLVDPASGIDKELLYIENYMVKRK